MKKAHSSNSCQNIYAKKFLRFLLNMARQEV